MDVTITRGLLSDEGAVVVIELLDQEGALVSHRSLRASLTEDRQVVLSGGTERASELRVTFYPCTGECPSEADWSRPEQARNAFGVAGAASCTKELGDGKQYRVSAEAAATPCTIT